MTNRFNDTNKKHIKLGNNIKEITRQKDEYIKPAIICENIDISPLSLKSDLNSKLEKGVTFLSIKETENLTSTNVLNTQPEYNSYFESNGIDKNMEVPCSTILPNKNESKKFVENEAKVVGSNKVFNGNCNEHKAVLPDDENSDQTTILRKRPKITTNTISELHESKVIMKIHETDNQKGGTENSESNKVVFISEQEKKQPNDEKSKKINFALSFIKETAKLLENNSNTHFINSLVELTNEENEENFWLKIEKIQRLIKDTGNLLKFYTFMPLVNLKQVFDELCSCGECYDKIGRINILDTEEYLNNSNVHGCKMFLRLFNLYLNGKISSTRILKYVYSLLSKRNYIIVKETLARYVYLYTPPEEIIGSYVYDKITNKWYSKVDFKSSIPTKSKEKLDLEDAEDEFFSIEIENDRLLFYKNFIKTLLKGKFKKGEKILIFPSAFKLISEGNKLLELFNKWNKGLRKSSQIHKHIEANKSLLRKCSKSIKETIRERKTSLKMENLKKRLATLQFKAAKPSNKPRYIPRTWIQEDIVCKIIREVFETQITNFVKEKFPGKKNLTNLKKLLSFFNCKPSNFNISKKEFDAFLHLASCLYSFSNVKISNPDFITPLYRNLTTEEYNELFAKIETFLETRFGKDVSKYEELYNSINTQYNYTSAPIMFYKVKFDFLMRNKISTIKEGKNYILSITEKDTIFPGCNCCLTQKMRVYKVKEAD